MSLLVPLYCHPVTVSLIDDNQDYLDNLMLKLSGSFLCECYSDAEEAANKIDSNLKRYVLTSNEFEEDEDPDQLIGKTDLRAIYKKIYDAKRFGYPGVVVADYEMPRLNGLDFCKKLSRNIKRILLTGVADQETAIQAFNKKLIDAYISKGKKTVSADLVEKLNKVQRDLFIELSEKMLMHRSMSKLTALYDNSFADYFFELIASEKTIEFYVTDGHGAFLLINADGQSKWLIVKSKTDLTDFYNIAKDSGSASVVVLEKLKTGSAIPYFFGEEDLQTPPSEWGDYLFDATKIEGETETYFVCVTDSYPRGKDLIGGFKSYRDVLEGS